MKRQVAGNSVLQIGLGLGCLLGNLGYAIADTVAGIPTPAVNLSHNGLPGISGMVIVLLLLTVLWLWVLNVRRARENTRASQSLRLSQQRLRYALEGSNMALWDYDIASGEIYFSKQMALFLGREPNHFTLPREEYAKKMHPEDVAQVNAMLKAVLNDDVPNFSVVYRVQAKDGDWKWLRTYGKVVERGPASEALRLTGTLTDITLQKHMQEALRLQAHAMDTSVSGILIADASQADMPIVYCNKGFEQLTGYRSEEMLGINCRFLQGQDRDQPELDSLREALNSEMATTVLLRNFRKNGELFWNELSISPVRSDSGKLTHFIGICNDVTEQIEAREALRRENEFSTTAINALPGAFYVVSKDNRILRLNDNVTSITGYSQAELAQMQPLDFYVEEDRSLIAEKIAETFRDGHSECEARILSKSGKIIPFYLQSQKKMLEGQECLVGTGVDISHLRQMQQALSQSQTTLNTIIEHMPAMVFLKRAEDLAYVLLNKVGEDILEYRRDEVLDRTDEELFSPGQAMAMKAVDHDVLASKQARILPETLFVSRSGWQRYLYTVKTALYDEEGCATHLLGISIDISDRKHAETKLRTSETLLKEAQQIAKLGNWTLNVNEQERHWSEQMFHVLGLSPGVDEASYENFFSRLHPEDLARVKDSERRAFTEGTPHSLDARIVRADGETRWVHIEAEAGRDENGKAKRLTGTLQDITERKLAEQAVEFSEARMRTILETAVDSIIIIDSNGIVESANPATEKIFGYSIEELLGNNISMLMPEPDRSAHDGYLQHYQATDEAHIIGVGREVVGQRKDGSTFPMDLAVSEIRLGDKRMFTGFVRDISLRKQVETELVTAKEQAEQASHAKSEFLSNMSHELRTPMNAILGFAQLLMAANPPLSNEQRHDVREIYNAGQHLLHLINELLDLARIEAGRMEITKEPVLVWDVMNESISMINPMLSEFNVGLVTNDCEGKDYIVLADRMRLRQILLNLLSNAVKYNVPGGSVTMTCHVLPSGRVQISVEDTGTGIEPCKQAELFHPFERLGADKTETEGTGIGLALTRKLLQLMGGEIGVNSVPGVGSRFWIELPEADAHTRQDESGAKDNLITVSTEREAVTSAKHTILYIEDNAANLRFMSSLLARRPSIELLTATDPVQGLMLAESTRPDLILLDINLPGMDGYEVLSKLQQESCTRNIPVIAVSANAMPEDIGRAMTAGFTDYCTKPIEINRLQETLDSILN